jgi:hypothetical protein
LKQPVPGTEETATKLRFAFQRRLLNNPGVELVRCFDCIVMAMAS